MKTLHRVALAIVASSLLTGIPAKGTLIPASDPRFGLNSLTIDTSTGLAWLDVAASAGLSYQQVLADTQPGGPFSGYRYTTAPEVLNLYASAGIPGSGYYPLSTPSITSFISLVGLTGSINGQPGILALSGTSSLAGGQDAPAIYAFGYGGIQEYWVNSGGYNSDGTAYGATTSYPDLGSWLVTPVPENSDASIYLLPAASLMGFAFLQRKLRPWKATVLF
jgi:hypothetical protein